MSTTSTKRQQFRARFLPVMADGGSDPERGRRIEQLMAAQGWGPTALTRAMRIPPKSRPLIYDWKAGAPISSDMLERLAVALETTRRYIETGEGEPHYPRGEPPVLLLRQLADALEEQDDGGD